MILRRNIFVAIILLILFSAVSFMCGLNTATFASYAQENNFVYLGGMPIGLSATSDYFVVSEVINVTTKEGSFSPAMQKGIAKGDLIVSINGKSKLSIYQFNEEVQNSDEVILEIKKADAISKIHIQPVFDVTQNEKKLGMILKNGISGMGTMTFITQDAKFGALGHLICDEYGYGDIYSGGTIFDCDVTGYNRPKENIPGELRANVDFSMPIGTFSVNSISGIYGNTSLETSTLPKIEIAERGAVTAGKAQIYSTIIGDKPQYYDIEIVKTVKQNELADKSMVIRIIDKELKNKTGGILQGMSGSPIVQNGKLVGAVTHVFMNDPTKGFGIYAEWMLQSVVE